MPEVKPKLAAVPKTKRPRKSNPRREYVSGGANSIGQNIRALQLNPTDPDCHITAETYDKMLTDAEIAASVYYLKSGILADGWMLRNPLKKTDPDYDQAEEIRQFCQRTLDNLDRNLRDTFESMLDALVYGNKVAEVIYKIEEEGQDALKTTIQAIKVKPRENVAFVVDEYDNILGIYNTSVTGANSIISPMTTFVDMEYVLDRRKFFVLSIRGKDEDPRGTSVLRPAHTGWNLKQLVWPEYLRWLLQCAVPSLIGSTPEGAEPVYKKDASGEYEVNEEGEYIEYTPEEVLLSQLINLRNSTAISVPFGTKIDPVETNSQGTAFTLAIEEFNREITKGILFQELANREGRHQSRAAADSQTDVVNNAIFGLKTILASSFKKDVLFQLVSMNYGVLAAKTLTPNLSLGDTERRDFANDVMAIAQLFSVGFLHPEQLPWCDEVLAITDRDMSDPTPYHPIPTEAPTTPGAPVSKATKKAQKAMKKVREEYLRKKRENRE